MSGEPESTQRRKRIWAQTLLVAALVAAPIVAYRHWDHDMIPLALLMFYFGVGLVLKSPIVIAMLLGVVASPFFGVEYVGSLEEMWNGVIIGAVFGFHVGVIVELVWADMTRQRGSS